jgi:hypothetical protein
MRFTGAAAPVRQAPGRPRRRWAAAVDRRPAAGPHRVFHRLFHHATGQRGSVHRAVGHRESDHPRAPRTDSRLPPPPRTDREKTARTAPSASKNPVGTEVPPEPSSDNAVAVGSRNPATGPRGGQLRRAGADHPPTAARAPTGFAQPAPPGRPRRPAGTPHSLSAHPNSMPTAHSTHSAKRRTHFHGGELRSPFHEMAGRRPFRHRTLAPPAAVPFPRHPPPAPHRPAGTAPPWASSHRSTSPRPRRPQATGRYRHVRRAPSRPGHDGART